MAKHKKFNQSRMVVRLDSCRLGTGHLKRAYVSEERALQAKHEMMSKHPDATLLEAYACPVHGWHLGKRRVPRGAYKVIERHTALQVELGDRVVAQIIEENHALPTVRLMGISQRWSPRRHGSG